MPFDMVVFTTLIVPKTLVSGMCWHRHVIMNPPASIFGRIYTHWCHRSLSSPCKNDQHSKNARCRGEC